MLSFVTPESQTEAGAAPGRSWGADGAAAAPLFCSGDGDDGEQSNSKIESNGKAMAKSKSKEQWQKAPTLPRTQSYIGFSYKPTRKFKPLPLNL